VWPQIALGVFILLSFFGSIAYHIFGSPPRVVSAYGVSVCGLAHHVVLIYGDGRQRIVKGAAIISDKEVTEAVEKLPPAKAGAFNVCPSKAPPLKVY
jgi:hypothetical protein